LDETGSESKWQYLERALTEQKQDTFARGRQENLHGCFLLYYRIISASRAVKLVHDPSPKIHLNQPADFDVTMLLFDLPRVLNESRN